MAVNVNTETNTVTVLTTTTNNVTVVDSANDTAVTVTQPITKIIKVSAVGPQGIQGIQGLPGTSISGGLDGYFPLWVGDRALTSSVARQVEGSVYVSGSTIVSGAFTVTGSSTVIGNQVITGSLIVSGSSTFTGNQIVTGSTRGSVTALSIASNTASMDLSVGNFFTLQLVAGTNTYINPSSILPGQTSILTVSTVGSATVSWPSFIKQPSGSAYIPTTTTGIDIVTLASTDSSTLYVVNVKNMI